jgi:hypothetical protein
MSSASSTLFTESSTGTFSVTIDLSTFQGEGTGQGTVTADGIGCLKGHASESYKFNVTAMISPFIGNMTVFFDSPQPDNSTITLTCTDPLSNRTLANVYWTWPSVVPDAILVKAAPGQTVDGSNTDFSSYDITIL